MGHISGFLALALVSTGVLARAQATPSLAAIEARAGGRLGVLALDTGTGRTLSHRADERFAMCSTFKLLLATQVLHAVDEGKESLDRIIPYGPADMLEYAPITAKHLGERGMTVRALCEAAVAYSDNTAANLLLASRGGPAGYTQYVRTLGDPVTRLDRNEPALNTPVAGQDLDTTSPRAMLASVREVVLGGALSSASRELLVRWLLGNTTGAHRLKAGIPETWRIGDKTGTGSQGATNDIGILYPPGRAPILVTAYYSGSKASQAEREAVLAEVGRRVASDLK